MFAADDQVFLKRFSLIIVLLAVFALAILFLSIALHNTVYRPEPPARDFAREQRLAPVAGVFVGETGRAAALAAQAAASAPAVTAAFDGSLDPQLIYQRVCAACHESGALGAPMLVAAQWVGRVEQGKDVLIYHAINGIRAKPPRGGRMDLTDEQIEVTVAYMLDRI